MGDRVTRAARAPRSVSFFNPLLKFLLRAGVPLGPNGLITIRGRKSGLPRTTPVAIIEDAGRRWVWAPWGDVNWVRNLRAAGRATITMRRRTEEIRATELHEAQRIVFFRDVLGRLARRTRSVSCSFGSSMVSISVNRWKWPRIAVCSSSTPFNEDRAGPHYVTGAIITHGRLGQFKFVMLNSVYLALAAFVVWGRFGRWRFTG